MKAEGIIQQICKKYISNDALSYEAKNTAYQIEQDLIAAINKAAMWNGELDTSLLYIAQLIGEE